MAFSNLALNDRVLRALLGRATVSIWLIDEAETVLFVNDAASDLTGYKHHELIGEPISKLMAPEIGAAHSDYIRAFFDRGGESSVLGKVREFDIVHKNGKTVPIEVKAFALSETLEFKRLFGAFISDNSAHKNAEEEMKRLARVDYLTHCINRLGFMERSQQELARAGRTGRPLSLIVMDLDHFKTINDKHGHQAGDQVLKELVPTLCRGLRAQDVFARVGGEEFFVILPETELAGAAEIAERMRADLAAHKFIYNEKEVPVTASFGCAELASGETLDILIKKADQRMYMAKHAGRNGVVSRHADDSLSFLS